jgi:precorrin-6Y C5,15-methyltransferase (decarboxylating)
LASGDPGFFGIVRSLLRVIDRKNLVVLPAPSSVSLAFARIGLPWDDATVVSAHGRPLADAIGAIRVARKVAVLTSPESPPEAVGEALVAARAAVDVVAVCSRLGHPDESVTMVGLDDLASGAWDPLSVVILLGPAGRRIAGWGGAAEDAKPLAWGLPDDAYGHRDGMITKSEVRAVALGKLALPPTGVLWDVGAGSGSVAVECASLSPGLVVFAIEERSDDIARISENASRFGVGVTAVHGHVPEACEGLPDPDRVFVGGGGLAALDVALARLRPRGCIVATFAALDRAAEAADRLGNLVQVGVSRAKTLPDGGVRLAAENPVFVAWGPEGRSAEA